MNNQIKGAGIISLSAIFFGSYGIWARLIGENLPNLFQVWVRSFIITVVLIICLLISRSWRKIENRDWKWVAVYTLFGSCAVAPYFYAFNTIGIGPSTLLFYAALTIVSYVAGLFAFGEKLTPVKIASLVLSIVGLYFIFDFSIKINALFAAACAVFSGIGGGVEVCFTKKISHRYGATQISLMLWIVVLVVHFILSLLFNETWTLPTINLPWLGVIGYALSSLAAFFLVVIGYKYVEPSVGGIVGLLEIVFGIVFGVIFFAEPLTTTILVGAGLITLSAILPNLNDLSSQIRTWRID